jgi:hypothetical protein
MDPAPEAWKPLAGGFPSGRGSEEGIVRLDEEHPVGARVTLEEGGRTAPWSITCGLYGWMAHTVFCGSELEARSKVALIKDRLLELAATARSGPSEATYAALGRFVEDF